MYYSDDIIEEVRSRSDIVDVVSGYVKLQRRGSSYFGLCPFHNEKTPSFSVSPDKQMYYCFGCGAGGSVFNFIMEYENFTFPEAVRFLAERAGIALPEEEYSPEEKKKHDRKGRILEINKMAATFYYHQLRSAQGSRGMEYLKGRALTDETITHFGLGFAGQDSSLLYRYLKKQDISDELLKETGLMQVNEKKGMYDRFWNRVIFPIMDINNKVIGFGGRVMGDGKPKYLNSPETSVFDKSRNLYGMNFARTARPKRILLCEGYMDVISMHQAGFTNAVASLGTALTSQHAALLKRCTSEVILTYDSDEAGVRAAMRAIPILKEAGITARVLHMDPYKDPDEFIKARGAEAFQERIDEAENSFLFELSVMERSHNMKDPDEKTQFFREVAARIAESELEIERENYIEATVERYHISFEAMRKMVSDELRAGGPAPRIQPRTIERRTQKEDVTLKSERLLLTALAEKPALFPVVSDYLSPEDFSEGIYREVAGMLYTQLKSGKTDTAMIADTFAEPEEQHTVAEIFNTKVPVKNAQEMEKVITDSIRKVMGRSIEQRSAALDPGDMKGLQAVMTDRRRMEQMKNLNIQELL